jgi:hypothetical protein
MVPTHTERWPFSTPLIVLSRVSLLVKIREGEARRGWALIGLRG